MQGLYSREHISARTATLPGVKEAVRKVTALTILKSIREVFLLKGVKKMDKRISKANEFLTEVMKNKKVIIPQQNLIEDLGLNSIQYMELIGKIENEYNVIVPMQKLQYLKTVSDLYGAIQDIEGFCR